MTLNLKRGASPQKIARLHQNICEARLQVLLAVERDSVLKAHSADALLRIANRLQIMLFSLEGELMRATGDENAPFANPRAPAVWVDWLRHREGK